MHAESFLLKRSYLKREVSQTNQSMEKHEMKRNPGGEKTMKGRRNEMKESFRPMMFRAGHGWIATLAIPILLVLIVGFTALSASAIERPFTAVLNGGQEDPPNDSESFGVAFMTFDTISKMLCYSITFSALSSDEVSAHFHGPAAPGESASVMFAITPVPGRVKNGCVGPFGTQQIRQLNAGQVYLNVHSVDFPSGEIRGQVLPVPANVKY